MALKLLRIANNVFSGEIFKFINNDLINDEDNNSDKYIIYNPSFFKKLSHVIISDTEQLNFVKENFVMDIMHIKWDKLIFTIHDKPSVRDKFLMINFTLYFFKVFFSK